MQSLNTRIATLEQTVQPDAKPTIVVRFVSRESKANPVTRIRCGAMVWTIESGESESAFVQRAKADARAERGHSCTVLFAE